MQCWSVQLSRYALPVHIPGSVYTAYLISAVLLSMLIAIKPFWLSNTCLATTYQIMDHSAPVQWDDIAGLQFAKATIKEIVVWPMLRP